MLSKRGTTHVRRVLGAFTHSATRPHVCLQCRLYATEAFRAASVAESSTADLKPGSSSHGFILRRIKDVPELELTAYHLQHERTGAEYLHVARDDKNNVFSVGFKTNPPDRTGVPHILEHLALCGSKSYPVRDPFFKMMPRSLSNFMNAMTYPDHTVYPFATTNPQDYKNLMSVYLDATLHPLLRSEDFSQEGWRVGPLNPAPSGSDLSQSEDDKRLVFKGVVYNEMKGAMSNADQLFNTRWQEHIFPAINNSGGVPQQMTNLTHDQLKRFHAEHYHPSNAKLFTYGDIALNEHLKDLASQLDQFDRLDVDPGDRYPISLAKGAEAVTILGPADPLYPKDEQYKASLSWLMCDTSDVLETFSLGLISSLLLDGFSAPLYQNTVEIGWGASYSPNTGFDASGKIAIFSIGLNGLKKHDVDRLNDGIQNTLQSVKRKGFDLNKIEGRLHQLELAMKHKSAHFGMELMSRLQDGWFVGIDPFSAVAPGEIIATFRERMEEPGYLESLYEKYWLKGNTFKFVMEPAGAFEQDLVDEEMQRLDAKMGDLRKQFLSDDLVYKNLEQQELDLIEMQETAKGEDLGCLPSLRVADIERKTEQKETRHSTIDGTKIQWRQAPTNGLTYFRAIRTLKNLPDELRVYLPLFSAMVQRLGTKRFPVEQLEDLIKLKTGGIGVSHHSSTSPYDLDICEDGLAFVGHAFDRNVPDMYGLLHSIISETNFDKRDAPEKIMELIKGAASTAINDVSESGSAYAQRFAEAGISPQARLNEEVDGMTNVRLMLDLARRPPGAGLDDVIEKLKVIQSFALSGGNTTRVALTCGPESVAMNENALQGFLSAIPSDLLNPAQEFQVPYPQNTNSFFPLPYSVYYTALACRTVPYTHEDSAPLRILAELLTHRRIHGEIREKGGAYGAGAYAAPLRGIFGYSSYRDPNPLNSLKVMRETGTWARDQQWKESDLEEAKLSLFQNLDAPLSVNSEGMTRFLTGVDPDMEQEHRDRLLDVTSLQLQNVAQKYLVGKEEEMNAVVLGKKQDWVSKEEWIEMPMSGAEGGEDGNEDDGYLYV